MLQKGIVAAALIAATSSVYAGGIEVAPVFIGGAYVDVGLSRDDVYDNFRRNTTVTVNEPLEFFQSVVSSTNSVDAGARGWDGFVGVGYNYVWNEWSFGFEVSGDVSSARGTQFENHDTDLLIGRTTSTSLYLRAERTIGVSLMPGYYVAPGSLYFVELGYANTEFNLTGLPVPYSTGDALNANAFPSRETDRSGFRLGFGTTTQVGAHVAIREEYVWETYGNFGTARTFSTEPNESFNTTTTARSVRVRPNISKYDLAAVYYFARQGNAPDLSTPPAHVGGNFYAGLNGSYDEDYAHSIFTDIGDRVVSNATNFVVADGVNGDGALLKGTGWNIGLLAGYGYNFTNRWYLGGEMFGNYDDVNGRYNFNQGNTREVINGAGRLSNTAQQINSSLEKNWDMGAALIPGYQVSDHALLYARVGYVGGKFSVRNTLTGATSFTRAQNTLLTGKRSRWLNGLQLGVGVDTIVYENVSLRTEFNINNYGSFNVNRLVSETDDGDTTSIRTLATTHRRIIEDQVNLALIWHCFG